MFQSAIAFINACLVRNRGLVEDRVVRYTESSIQPQMGRDTNIWVSWVTIVGLLLL